MHGGGYDPGACWNWHSHKIFPPGTAGIGWLGIHLDIEAGQSAGSGNQEDKGCDEPQLHKSRLQCCARKVSDPKPAKAPHECKNRGRNSECDDVSQGIKLAPEVAGGVSHAGDSAIQAISDHGDTDGFSCDIEMPVIGLRSLQGMSEGEIACADVRCR